MAAYVQTQQRQIPGGRGDVILYADRLELHAGGTVKAFPYRELSYQLVHHDKRYYWTSVEVDKVLRVKAGLQSLALSQRMFSRPQDIIDLFHALEALVAGEPLPKPPVQTKPADHENYEAALDKELNEL